MIMMVVFFIKVRLGQMPLNKRQMFFPFTTPDPLAGAYYNISPYAYSANNPINAIDKEGKLVIFINGNHFGDGGKEDYWKDSNHNFASSFISHFNDMNTKYSNGKYYDGSMGGFAFSSSDNRFNVSVRMQEGYNQGYWDAADLIKSLARTGGVITEGLFVCTHSMGAAYAKGFVMALKRYAEENPEECRGLRISQYDFASFQQNQLFAVPGISTFQYDNENEKVVGGIVGFYQGSKHAKQRGLDDKNYNRNVNPNGGHSILDFWDEIINLPEGRYRYENGEWVRY